MYKEAAIQQQIFIWYNNTFCLKHHEPRHVIFSVPNESKSKSETLAKMAIGMLPGVSDLILLQGGETIFVEVKTPTGVQSKSQKVFQARVQEIGYRYLVVRSLEDFKNQMEL